MGRASRAKAERLRIGEVVRLRGKHIPLPSIRCRVEFWMGSIAHCSVGRSQFGISPDLVTIEARALTEPQSWLEDEIALARHFAAIHDCADCRALLKQREAEQAALARERLNPQ